MHKNNILIFLRIELDNSFVDVHDGYFIDVVVLGFDVVLRPKKLDDARRANQLHKLNLS
jgi:hypothetical protein